MSVSAASAQIRLQLIRFLSNDGKLTDEEVHALQDLCKANDASDCSQLLLQWQNLQEGKRGFRASELVEAARKDPHLILTWARLARDQERFKRYFTERDFGRPLMESPNQTALLFSQVANLPLDKQDEREEYERLVAVLASDLFEGRDSGTLGGERARLYLSDEIRDTINWNVRLQPVTIPTDVSYQESENYIAVGNEAPQFTAGVEIMPYIFCPPESFVHAPVVFLPISYTAKDLNKVQGKIVVFEPPDADFNPLEAGQKIFKAGAKGMMVCADEYNSDYFQWPDTLSQLKYEPNREVYWLNEPSRHFYLMDVDTRYRDSFPLYLQGPAFYIGPDTKIHEQLQKIKSENSSAEVTLHCRMNWNLKMSYNILAERPSEKQGSVLLASAHYDHLGKTQNPYQPRAGMLTLPKAEVKRIMIERDEARLGGAPLFERGQPLSLVNFPGVSPHDYEAALASKGFIRDAIYNGATDNASGCALILLLARELNGKVPLSIAFFTGEEHGLFGSQALAKNWNEYFPERKLNVLLNTDMPAAKDPRFPKTIQYRFLGEQTGLEQDLLKNAGQLHTGYELNNAGYADEHLEQVSDQYSFVNFKESKLLLLDGGYNEEYHAPGDTEEVLDYDKGLAALAIARSWLEMLHK